MPILLALISAAGYGLGDFCFHLGMKSGRASSSQILIINLLTGNILLFIFVVFMFITQGIPALNWQGILYFAAAGVSAPFLGRILTILAIKEIGATRASTLRVSDTFFTMIIAVIFLGDYLSLLSIVGAIILFIGIGIMINDLNKDNSAEKPQLTSNVDPFPADSSSQPSTKRLLLFLKNIDLINYGSFLALLSAFSFALGSIFRQIALQYIPVVILGTFIQTFVALVTNGITAYSSGQLGDGWNIKGKELLIQILGGVGGTIGLLGFFFSLSHGGSVSMAAALKNTSPVFTLVFSWWFLRKTESYTIRLILSLLLVIIGAVFVVN